MPQRRCFSNHLRRNSFSMLLAASTLWGGLSVELLAQSPPAAKEPILRIATAPTDMVPTAPPGAPAPTSSVHVNSAPLAEETPTELQLRAPINSTLEIRVARSSLVD